MTTSDEDLMEYEDEEDEDETQGFERLAIQSNRELEVNELLNELDTLPEYESSTHPTLESNERFLYVLEQLWKSVDKSERYNHALKAFDLREESDHEEVRRSYDANASRILTLSMRYHLMVNNSVQEATDANIRLSIVFQKMKAYFELVYAHALLNRLTSSDNVIEDEGLSWVPLTNNTIIDKVIPEGFSRVGLRCLRYLKSNHYKREGKYVCKPVYNDKNQYTGAWERSCTIEEMYWRIMNVTDSALAYIESTKYGSLAKTVVAYLTNVRTEYFTDVQKSRYLLSFKNGVFNTSNGYFFAYDSGSVSSYLKRAFKDVDYITQDGVDTEPNRWVSCIYHNVVFRDWRTTPGLEEKEINKITFGVNPDGSPMQVWDWRYIPLKRIPSIFRAQDIPIPIENVNYAMNGRMFFEGGVRDNWQIAWWYFGMAGAGKGTLLDINASVFPKDRQGNLSTNSDKWFLSSCIDHTWATYAPDLKANCGWPQSEYQQAVSLEKILVNEKGVTPYVKQWTQHFLIAANEPITAWKDSSGSLTRRTCGIIFNKLLKKTEIKPKLKQEILENEFDLYIQKCVYAYLELSHKFADADIFVVLSDPSVVGEENVDYFASATREILGGMDPLQQYIDDNMELGTEFYTSEIEFRQDYLTWAAKHTSEVKYVTWNRNLYGGVFQALGVNKNQDKRIAPGSINQPPTNGPWLIGMRYKSSSLDLDIFQNFMEHNVEYSPSFYESMDLLKDKYLEFAKQNSVDPKFLEWNKNLYKTEFSKRNIKIDTTERITSLKEISKGPWAVGLRLKNITRKMNKR